MVGLSDSAATMTAKFCTFVLILMGMAAHLCLGNVPYQPSNRYNVDDYYLQPSIRSYVSPNYNYNSGPSRSPNYNNYDRSDNYDRDSYRGRSGSSRDRYPSRQKDYDRDDRYDRNYDGGRGNGRDYSYRSSSKNDYDRDYFNYPNNYIKPTPPVCTTKTTTTTETATPSCATTSTYVYQQYISQVCFRTGTATSKLYLDAALDTKTFTEEIGNNYDPCSTTIHLPTIKKAYGDSTPTSVPCIGTITLTKTKFSGLACTFLVQNTEFTGISNGEYKEDACPYTSSTTFTTCLDSNGKTVTALKQMKRTEDD